jgi:hypothetical protein
MKRTSARTLVSDGARIARPIAPSTVAAADARSHARRHGCSRASAVNPASAYPASTHSATDGTVR